MRNLPQVLRTMEQFTKSHSPLILTSLGVAGIVSTALLTGKATIVATRVIDAIKEERLANPDYADEPDVPFKEVVSSVWRLYIPPLSVAAVSITCVIAANRIGTRRAAAMAAAYTIAERSFEEYRDKVVEKIGEKKEREVRDAVQQDRVDRNPPPKQLQDIQLINPGDCLCYDRWSDRWFQSSQNSILKAQNDLNYQMLNHDYGSLNEFYSKIGLGPVKMGDMVGWTAMEKLELIITTVQHSDGRPALAIDFLDDPKEGYTSTHN